MDADIAAMRAGACNFLLKSALTARSLQRSIRYAVWAANRQSALVRKVREDALTGLHNRTSIEERLQHAVGHSKRTGKPMAVLLIDLDGFKAINDTLGHAAGDSVLKTVARRLRQTLRNQDFIGRLGGDEFVAITENIANNIEVDHIAERIVRAIEAPFPRKEKIERLSASIGHVCFPGPITEATALLKAADEAMYAAKRDGKGCHRRYGRHGRYKQNERVKTHGRPERNEQPKQHKRPERHQRSERLAHQTQAIASSIPDGLSEAELRLALQPQIDLRSGRPTGFESLVRWGQPVSMDAPVDLANSLVRSSASGELDLWAIERTLRLASSCQDALSVAV
ncbi:MAG: diguanylate cyclase, partial [Myxococcota bacterium]